MRSFFTNLAHNFLETTVKGYLVSLLMHLFIHLFDEYGQSCPYLGSTVLNLGNEQSGPQGTHEELSGTDKHL